MREERIVVAGRELVIARPEDPEALIDESRFGTDEFLPYWAELWPSGIALARHVAGLKLAGMTVLEVGCGLALPSFGAALAGAHVLATDWAPEAVELVAANARTNGLDIAAAVLAWGDDRSLGVGPFDLVLASDVLYEERNARPLLRLIEAVVAPRGAALIADPGRRHAPAFFATARSAGWALHEVPTASGIVRLVRDTGPPSPATQCT